MNQKTLVLIGTILTIIFGIFASFVAWFGGGKDLEGISRDAIRQMFNFEITFLILAVLLGWIPFIGQILVLVLWVANIVFAIQAFNAVEKNTGLKILCLNIIK